LNTNGLIAYSTDGTTFNSTGYTATTGAVHSWELFLDCGSGITHIAKLRVDGVEVMNLSFGTQAITTSPNTNAPCFLQAVQSDVIDISDVITYNDAAQYGALGSDWRVHGLTPTGDGTHSFTTGDFQDQSSANIATSSTTSYQLVDEFPTTAPTNSGDFVKQVVSRTAGYLEWTFSSLPENTDPVLVCLAAAVHPVGGNAANLSQFRLVSGANVSAEATIDASVATDTLEYRKHHYTTEPGGAAWTYAKANALRVRYGFSTDISPPPALDSVMIFAAVPYTPPASTVRQDSVMVV
jgi:hypothetical protein